MKIMIGPARLRNAGDMAILMSMVHNLREVYPNTSFIALLGLPANPNNRYASFFEEHNVKLLSPPRYRLSSSRFMRKFSSLYYNIRAIFTLFRYTCHRRYDLCIENGTDHHSGERSFPHLLNSYVITFVPSVMTKKPFVLCAASMGPFRPRLVIPPIRFILNQVSLITVRETISIDFLSRLRVTNPNIHLTADPAFLLEPAPQTTVDHMLAEEAVRTINEDLVGISASQLIWRYMSRNLKNQENKRERYTILMAMIADHLVEKLGATVIFIPHSTAFDSDDRIMQEKIFQKIRNKHRIRLLSKDYRADELKGIIGRCKMFIGCRMHTTIAATSMHVPTIAISYSYKFQGVLSSILDPEKCIVDITQSTPEELFFELCSKIDYVWEHREKNIQELKEKMPEVRRRAMLNIELIKELFDELPKSKTPG